MFLIGHVGLLMARKSLRWGSKYSHDFHSKFREDPSLSFEEKDTKTYRHDATNRNGEV
jgi:hypothetical protein